MFEMNILQIIQLVLILLGITFAIAKSLYSYKKRKEKEKQAAEALTKMYKDFYEKFKDKETTTITTGE